MFEPEFVIHEHFSTLNMKGGDELLLSHKKEIEVNLRFETMQSIDRAAISFQRHDSSVSHCWTLFDTVTKQITNMTRHFR